MDRSPTADTRQHITTLIEDAGSLLQMIPRLLEENEQMRMGTERLRADNDQMRASTEQLRANAERAQHDADILRGEIARLKNELAQVRAEHDMCTKAMTEAAGVINEMLLKLRTGQHSGRFARDPGAPPDFTPRPTPAASSST